ncbi:hypothetical protein H4582DRAFT_1092087 [Lactarius indigo]|nr:hypothetical protein H4582DRAFT_1092087 [Lactarius indigo]
MTLLDMQTPALINSSTILLGRSLASYLHALQLAYLRCIGTAIFFHYRARSTTQAGTDMAHVQVAQTLYVGSRARQKCKDLLQANIKNSYHDPGAYRVSECTLPGMVPQRLRPPRPSPVRMTRMFPMETRTLDSHEFVFGRQMGLMDTPRRSTTASLSQKIQKTKIGPTQRRRRQKARRPRRRCRRVATATPCSQPWRT